MNQIYDFEQHEPPELTEKALNAVIEARKERRQAALVAAASVLSQASLLVLGYSAIEWYPWLTALCLATVFLGTSCGVVLAALASRKGGLVS